MGSPSVTRAPAGVARLAFHRSKTERKTVVSAAFATSPLRILAPRNHGDAAWLFLACLGGGLVDGDHVDVEVDVAEGASALLATQASTKVYRGTEGCSQRLSARVEKDAMLAVIPDPVVCFADARYDQTIDVTLAPSASLCLLDGYTCGRSARGERWAFSRYATRMTVTRGGALSLVDATWLDPRHGSVADRMGRFDVVLSFIALGPHFARVRDAIVRGPVDSFGDAVLAAGSPLGEDGGILRVAAEHFESASRALRTGFAALASVLGDDPFARKW
jgi:urease accessory protein